MKTLRDAQAAAQTLGHAIGGKQQQHADTIADAIGALSDRLAAIEAILFAVTTRAGISSAEILQTALPTQNAHSEIRRIVKS